jgi:hypothetical protein
MMAGIIMGILTFAKNEGPVMAILLSSIFSGIILWDNSFRSQRKNILSFFFIGLFLALPATLIFKFTMSPPNRDMSFSILQNTGLIFNPQRLGQVFDFFYHAFNDQAWHFIWLLLGAMIILGPCYYVQKELKLITLFLLSFIFCLTIIYLSTPNFDLAWRLSRTVPRILFYLLPTVLFLSFSAHWRIKE